MATSYSTISYANPLFSAGSPSGHHHVPLYREVLTWVLFWPMICLIARQAPYISGPARDALLYQSGVGNEVNHRFYLYPVMAFQLCFTLMAPREIWALLKQNPLVLAGPLLIFISILWTEKPPSTFNSGVEVALCTCFACFLAIRMSPERLMQLVMFLGVFAALFSIFFAVALPSYGLFAGYSGGAWQGICGHKNTLGVGMLYLLTPVFFVKRFSNPKKFAYVLLIIFVLVMSQSRGAEIETAAFLLFVSILWLWRRFRRTEGLLVLLCVSLTTIVFVGFVFAFASQLAPLLGKSATMSGRTDIYREVWISIQKAPLLGYGYGSFWRVNRESIRIGNAIRWNNIGYSENGILELALQLGLAGVIVVLLMLGRAVVQGIRLLRSPFYSPQVGWFLSILFVAGLTNIDAGWLLVSNTLDWLLIVIACMGLQTEMKKHLSSAR